MSADAASAVRLAALPRLGVGIGWRREIGRRTLRLLDRLDVLEVLADTVIGKGRAAWEEALDLAGLVPVVLHGVNLSLASDDCLEDRAYLRELRRLVRATKVPYYGDHAALTKSRGRRLGHLSPVWRTERQLRVMCRNVAAVQDMIGVPLVVENIAAPFDIPGAELSETEFLNALVRRTGCGLHLDVENLALNAANLAYDADAWLARLDRGAVVQIHLAGGVKDGPLWVDTHSRPVAGKVWSLFRRAAEACPNLKVVTIERDDGFADFDIAGEVARVRRLWRLPA